jgi:hypothetical protein
MAIGISSSYDEYGWDNSDEGYRQAMRDITKYVQGMKEYYAEGTMCSMSESTIGESVCDDILEYLDELNKRR